MKNIYYQIWASALSGINENIKDPSWKWKIFVLISFINSLNAFTIILWLQYFHLFNLPRLALNFLPPFASGLSFLLSFASPFIILNYFFIFHRKKYEEILTKYPNIPKTFAFRYIYSSLGIAWISAMYYGVMG